MKKYILLTLLAIGLFSCSSDEDKIPNLEIVLLPLTEAIIPDTLYHNNTFDVKLKYTLPNGCYYFSDVYYTAKDSTRTLAFYAIHDLDAVCTQATIEDEFTIQLRANQTEDYIFKIWKGKNDENEDIYDEHIARVIEEGELD